MTMCDTQTSHSCAAACSSALFLRDGCFIRSKNVAFAGGLTLASVLQAARSQKRAREIARRRRLKCSFGASRAIKTLSALCDNTALLAILSARPDFGKQCL